MGLFDRLRAGLGVQRPLQSGPHGYALSADERAIARYRYLLRTAPPEAIERAHAEAFTQLTPQQRQRLLQGFAAGLPDAERVAALRAEASPGYLARTATRAELRRPGSIEQAMGGIGVPVGGGTAASAGFTPAFPGAFAGSLLAGMAGAVLGSAIARQFFTHHDGAFAPPGTAGDPHATAAPADVEPGLDAGIGTFGEQSGFIDAYDTDDNYGGFDSGDTFDV
jgi:hypothetical protein